MKKNHVTHCIFLMLLGVIVSAVGIFVISENLKTVSGLCIGVGAALISMNAANLIISLYYKKHPDLKKQSEIESKDERTVAITNKAKSKAFDITVSALIIFPFLLILADSPLWITLTAVTLYSFGFGAQIYFTIRYNKEM